MKHRLSLFILAFFALSFAGAYYLGGLGRMESSADESAHYPPPKYDILGGLAVEASLLDLGDVWEDSEYALELPLRNQTGQEIRVTEFAASCGCVSLRPETLTIPPKDSKPLQVTLDLTKRQQSEVGRDVRPFVVDLSPRTSEKADSRPQSWRIQGRVKSRVTLDTLALHFGEKVVQGEPPVSRKVFASVHVPARAIEVRVDKPEVMAVRAVALNEDKSRYQLEFTPNADVLPLGPFKTTATVQVVTAEGETFRGPSLPVEGIVQPEIRLFPAQLLLGSRPHGKRTSKPIY